jgi:O-acetyl-ADP-ribose deacetylase (regulator of RNase III)
MIRYTTGNLLEADVDALVNTVNTEGVMGKGIALMFKERFPDNYKRYQAACKADEVRIGKMFATEVQELDGPKWVINFPTKRHWRPPSKLEWIVEGLQDLRNFLREKQIKSVAIPPLGAGNGGLVWASVREQIEHALGDLSEIDVLVYEPTPKYQNVAKHTGVDKLTPARALIAEMVRRYWVLGMECSLLEVQKLAWFLERSLERYSASNPLDLRFEANKYGPYADRLRHLLNGLDGSYLHCDKRISDAGPLDVIWFDDSRKDYLAVYLKGEEVKRFLPALEHTAAIVDGFESPFGMELLATVDWLRSRLGVESSVDALVVALGEWPTGPEAADRKRRLFSRDDLAAALERLDECERLPVPMH